MTGLERTALKSYENYKRAVEAEKLADRYRVALQNAQAVALDGTRDPKRRCTSIDRVIHKALKVDA